MVYMVRWWLGSPCVAGFMPLHAHCPAGVTQSRPHPHSLPLIPTPTHPLTNCTHAPTHPLTLIISSHSRIHALTACRHTRQGVDVEPYSEWVWAAYSGWICVNCVIHCAYIMCTHMHYCTAARVRTSSPPQGGEGATIHCMGSLYHMPAIAHKLPACACGCCVD